MRVVIAHESREAFVVDVPEPPGGRNYVTVRVSHSAVVLPDELYHLDAAPERLRDGEEGVPLGFCASGTVMAVGEGVHRIKDGVRVAVAGAPYVYHGAQLVVPENLVVELPKKVNHEEGAFAGMGARALHLVRTAGIQLGEVVVVMGGELLGLMAAEMVRATGGHPIVVEESDFRRKRAGTLGLVDVYTRGDAELVRAVDRVSGGDGADALLLTRYGGGEDFEAGEKLLGDGGRVVLGVPLGRGVELDALRRKDAVIRSALAGGPGAGDRVFEVAGAGYPRTIARWTERANMDCFCRLVADRKVQVSPLITDRMPIDRAPAIYEKARVQRDNVLAGVITY